MTFYRNKKRKYLVKESKPLGTKGEKSQQQRDNSVRGSHPLMRRKG
jgi:hypothetical protein